MHMPTHQGLFEYHSLTDQELSIFREQGFLLLRKVLTPEGLARIRKESMAAWHAEKEAFDPARSWLQNALLVNIHHKSQTIRDYYFEGPLVNIASQIISPNIKGATSQLTFKLAGNTKPFGWHQDNGYGELDPYTALTALTALDDTDRGNGCLWLIPGSHKQGQVKVRQNAMHKSNQTEIVVEADDSKAIPLEMEAGDAVIFHCWTLHKSDGNVSKDRDRRILFLRYADADAVEVYNDRRPRLGRLLMGETVFEEVKAFESEL
jgi:hypothetical protein